MSLLVRPSVLLSRALAADAVVTFAVALAMLVGAAPLAPWLGLPETLLRFAGLGLVPYAAWVGWLARRATLARATVGLVVACNLLWAVDCLVLLVSGWVRPTLLGQAFVVAQVVAVIAFAELQFMGLRRSPAQAGANA